MNENDLRGELNYANVGSCSAVTYNKSCLMSLIE